MNATNIGQEPPQGDAAPSRFQIWALVPVVLLGASLTLVLSMVSLSASDPGFAVEPDYYQKAVDWDAERARLLASERLGWSASFRFGEQQGSLPTNVLPAGPTALSVSLDDRDGAPVSGAALELAAFANARAGAVQTIPLSETRPGEYSGNFELHRPGLWVFRLKAQRDQDAFVLERQAEFSGPSPRRAEAAP